MKGLKDFPRENEVLVSTERKKIVQGCRKAMEETGNIPIQDTTNSTTELSTSIQISGWQGQKNEEKPGKLTGLTHIELGLPPAHNGSQGRLLQRMKAYHTTNLNVK